MLCLKLCLIGCGLIGQIHASSVDIVLGWMLFGLDDGSLDMRELLPCIVTTAVVLASMLVQQSLFHVVSKLAGRF